MLEKRLFYGGMDSDTDDRLIEQGDYRDAVNVRNSIPDKSDVGSLPNVKGNLLVPYTKPGGENIVIGHCDDVLGKRVFSFVWNENGDHHITVYSTTDGTRTTLVANSLLNFDPDFPILHIDVVEDLLMWADGKNENSAILISKAQTGFYDSVTLRKYFDAIAYPMQTSPTAVYVSDYNYLFNNLRSKVFQFRVTWVDEMNRESAASPISKLPIPYSELSYLPYRNYQNYINNKIELDVQTGFDMVRKINIYVREGNTGDWYLAKSLVKLVLGIGNNQTYTYDFYNDEVWTPVSQAYINRLFDFIWPANCQSLTSDKRVLYTNTLEGYDNIVPDCTVEAIYSEITAINSQLFASEWSQALGFYNIGAGSNSVTNTVSGPVGGVPYLGLIFNIGNVDETQAFSFEYATSLTATHATLPPKTFAVFENLAGTFPAGTTSQTIANYFAGLINASPLLSGTDDGFTFVTSATVQLQSPGIYGIAILTNYTAFGGTGYTPGTQTDQFTSFITLNGLTSSLKTGSQYDVGLVYYDNPNRSGLVQYTPTMKLKVDPYSQHPTQLGAIVGRITINHAPPSWANYYQVVITENLTKSAYVQIKVGTVAASPTGFEHRIYINTIADYIVEYPTATNLVYDFSPGDRVVLLKDAAGNQITDLVDVEIVASGTFAGDQYIEISNNITAPQTGSYIEIYTPKKNIAEKLFYEMGEVYPISNGFHRGDIQNQTLSQPAIVEFTGDCYFKYRPGNMDFFVEDKSLSDFYSSESWDKGRPNRIDVEAKQIRRPSTVYYSEPYVPETNLNGLSVIYDTSFESGDIKYGSIQRTYSEEDHVEFYYQLKTSQRLVNKSILYDSNATQNVQKSDTVLSQEIFYAGEFGIGDNPESFAVYENDRYHVDANRGVICRLTNSGYDPISNFKMMKYFSELLRIRVNFGEPFRAWGVFDIAHKEYVLCFEEVTRIVETEVVDTLVDGGVISTAETVDLGGTTVVVQGSSEKGAVPDESPTERAVSETVEAGTSSRAVGVTYTLEPVTISFSKPKNRWVERYTFYPECIGSANIGVVSYKDGDLYVHDMNTLYNNFYGVQSGSSITLVSNEEPSAKKVFQDIYTESTFPWAMLATNKMGQETSLLTTDFENIEGVFYAALLKDSNTPVTDPIINGDDMRDYTMEITLTNNETTESNLFAVNIRHVRSMLTNV